MLISGLKPGIRFVWSGISLSGSPFCSLSSCFSIKVGLASVEVESSASSGCSALPPSRALCPSAEGMERLGPLSPWGVEVVSAGSPPCDSYLGARAS